MSFFPRLRSAAHLAETPSPSEGSAEHRAHPAESPRDNLDADSQQRPSLLFSLGLAVLIHVLLLWALAVNPPARRGSDVASFHVELWPSLQARVPAGEAVLLPAPVDPAPPSREVSESEVVIEHKAAAQEKQQATAAQVIEPRPLDEREHVQPREQNQGCLGPEDMAKLEETRNRSMDQQADGHAEGLGNPCVEG